MEIKVITDMPLKGQLSSYHIAVFLSRSALDAGSTEQ